MRLVMMMTWRHDHSGRQIKHCLPKDIVTWSHMGENEDRLGNMINHLQSPRNHGRVGFDAPLKGNGL